MMVLKLMLLLLLLLLEMHWMNIEITGQKWKKNVVHMLKSLEINLAQKKLFEKH